MRKCDALQAALAGGERATGTPRFTSQTVTWVPPATTRVKPSGERRPLQKGYVRAPVRRSGFSAPLARSRVLTTRSFLPPLRSVLPSGKKKTNEPSPLWTARSQIRLPFAASRSLTSPSSPVVARDLPSGEKATQFTSVSWAGMLKSWRPETGSQRRTVPSLPAVTIRRPSGENSAW